MKKLSLILSGLVLFGGMSFARPVVKQQPAKASTTKTVKSKSSSTKSVKKSSSKSSSKKAAAAPAAK